MRPPAVAGPTMIIMTILLLLACATRPGAAHTPVVTEIATDGIAGHTTVRLALRMAFKVLKGHPRSRTAAA